MKKPKTNQGFFCFPWITKPFSSIVLLWELAIDNKGGELNFIKVYDWLVFLERKQTCLNFFSRSSLLSFRSYGYITKFCHKYAV